MQPLISVENVENIANEMLLDINRWRKDMVYYIKDENPEINTAIIEISKRANLDPKAVAAGAYMVYKLLESESLNSASLDEAEYKSE